MYFIDYENEQEFKRMERGLKKYVMLAYKKLVFDYYPQLRSGNFLGNKINDDTYEIKLPADKMFEQVHGLIKLTYKVDVKSNTIILLEITPKDIFFDGMNSGLQTYKGVMISNEHATKDIFKIDLLNQLKNRSK